MCQSRRMIRLRAALLAFPIAFAAALPATAGDYADRAFLGFSEDGRYFAFEEYGIQDGSGFPYANIFVIDIDSDSWVSGSPFRVRLDTETATLEQARAQAHTRAQGMIAQLGIGADGRLVASNPATEASADPFRVTFHWSPYFLGSKPWSLALSQVSSATPANCPPEFGPFYRLRLTFDRPDYPQQALADDTAIPGSRGCPVGYSISDVVLFPADNTPLSMVVLVNVLTVGFEGPDRRYIAVTTRAY